MYTFRAQPFEVQAFQFTGDNPREVIAWTDVTMDGDAPPMDEHGRSIRIAWRPGCSGLVLTPSDWLVCGGTRDIDVCYDEEFQRLYRPISEGNETR